MASELVWKRTELGPANPGLGDAATQLFEGRRSIDLGIFIREDLQNRVDARKDEKGPAAKVLISFKTLPAKLLDRYFPEQFREWLLLTETQHLGQADAERRTKEINAHFSSGEFPVLVIEDFETTGLNGPVNSKLAIKDSAKPQYHPTNSLTCFLRLNGRSGKSGKQLGSAGLGRHVYYKASLLSTKFMLTIPTDLCRKIDDRLEPITPRPLFFGQALLREYSERHGNSEKSYCSYYYLTGQEEKADKRDKEGLPMPFGLEDSESTVVEQAIKDFQLERKPGESGCSLIIPFPRPNLKAEALINTIVENFSMPILAGTLDVQVEKKRITAANLASLADKTEVNSHNRFLSSALNAKPDLSIKVNSDRLKKPLDTDLFEEDQLKSLACSYQDGDLVTLCLEIAYGAGKEQQGSLQICVSKSFGTERGKHIVARSGLVLSEYSDSNYTRPSNAIVLVQADNLGSLLRSVENPAHTCWLPGDIDANDCECPEALINFIKGAHTALERLLVNLDAEEDLNIFSDLLPAGGAKPTEYKPPPFDVSMNGDSFQIVPSKAFEQKQPTAWRLAIVYDSFYGSGRARKGYRPGTFNLQAIKPKVRGGKLNGIGDCHLDVTVNDPAKFRLEIGPISFAGWADIRFHAELLERPGVPSHDE